MWLTAFVVKSFSQASPFMFIDRADLNKSINWFKSKQTFNGCFPVVCSELQNVISNINCILQILDAV